jgi:archaellum component FlaC
VAFAGSMCHDTIDWAEDDHGGSVVDGIQQAANLAAKTINTQACDYEHEIKTLKARIKELEEETEFKSNQIEILKSDNKSKFKVIQNLKEIISTPPSTQEREE